MKRVVMAFALVSTVASVASAQLLRSSYPPSAAPKATVDSLLPARAEAQAPQGAKPTSTFPTPTLAARQAPVPMQPRNRPSAFIPPAVGPASAQTSADETTPAGTALADTILGGLTEGDARAAIEADGYRKARVVSKTADGTWRARALRGATEVSLRVDAQGNVMVD